MPVCLIGLGSNLGDRRRALDRAISQLTQHPQIAVTARSRWRETSPIGGPAGQPAFLNGAVVVETSLSPQAVLDVLGRIEADLGRLRTERWGPRTVDLDLLLYDELVLSSPSLVVPHARMAWRRFVLQPAAEVAGQMVHPTTGWTVARLLRHLDTAADYVAIAGSIGAGKTHLAGRLAERLGARLITERLDLELLDTFYADPASHARATELEFLHQRARLLAADSPQPPDTSRLVVSDFWYDQSLAFARVWLSPEELPAFRTEWERCRQQVVRPKLTVLLDASGEFLLGRVLQRGRPCERCLTEWRLEEIRRSILDEATRAGQGPVLQLSADDTGVAFDEVLAAVEAMH